MSLKYLGGVLTASEDDCQVEVPDLSKDWREWARISRILTQEGSDACTSVMFYKAVM